MVAKSYESRTTYERLRLLVETKFGRTLVDDGQCADSTSNHEPQRSSPDGPLSWVLAHVDDDFDEHEDKSTETSCADRSHSETSKDGSEALSLVPSPLDFGGTVVVLVLIVLRSIVQ